jgi:hypothetical protein
MKLVYYNVYAAKAALKHSLVQAGKRNEKINEGCSRAVVLKQAQMIVKQSSIRGG